ncbi:MAG: hypothetical protein R2706_18275 [Acidimicrobiales bacterium]
MQPSRALVADRRGIPAVLSGTLVTMVLFIGGSLAFFVGFLKG